MANDTAIVATGVYPRVSRTRQKLARILPKAPFHRLNSHAYILMLLLEDSETSRNIYMTDTDVIVTGKRQPFCSRQKKIEIL